MKAALIHRYGSNDQVRVADIPVPVMGAMDLLVRVHAASVNPLDGKTRAGKLKTLLKYRFPLVLGNDLSGVVFRRGRARDAFSRKAMQSTRAWTGTALERLRNLPRSAKAPRLFNPPT